MLLKRRMGHKEEAVAVAHSIIMEGIAAVVVVMATRATLQCIRITRL